MSKTKTAAMALTMILGTAAVIWMGISPSQAASRHTVWIVPGNIYYGHWQAYGDLYNGSGKLVYHWQEGNDETDYVRWGFTDGGDNGWLTIDIQAGERDTYHTSLRLEKQKLNRDYCFTIGDKAIVLEPTCTWADDNLPAGRTEKSKGEFK